MLVAAGKLRSADLGIMYEPRMIRAFAEWEMLSDLVISPDQMEETTVTGRRTVARVCKWQCSKSSTISVPAFSCPQNMQ
jgi:hypothetical protein